MMANQHLLTARETGLACILIAEKKAAERGRPVKYLRVSRGTLQKLSNRAPLSDDFLDEVGSWLWLAGWILFKAGTGFGLANRQAVENWPRTSSKLLGDDLAKMKSGAYEFREEKLFGANEDDDEPDQPTQRTNRRIRGQ
jgi:hypothetical protein